MLLPALSKAREKARMTSCTNKLKQLGLAMFMYADDYNSWLISNNLTDTSVERADSGYTTAASASVSGRVYLLKNGYLDKKIPASAEEQEALRKRHYQCPSDTKCFNKSNDSYYMFYFTKAWVPYSYRFGDVSYARAQLNDGRPGNIIAMDVGIYPVDKTNGFINHEGKSNALCLQGNVVTRSTTESLNKSTVATAVAALRHGDDYGCLDVR